MHGCVLFVNKEPAVRKPVLSFEPEGKGGSPHQAESFCFEAGCFGVESENGIIPFP